MLSTAARYKSKRNAPRLVTPANLVSGHVSTRGLRSLAVALRCLPSVLPLPHSAALEVCPLVHIYGNMRFSIYERIWTRALRR